ncbi:hypothetical protein Anapl_06911 [Anas platyrhynchos]|uniref:Uncharacterized protein n=1 Tax=Anas platyrhynchos TaxID=8839 RepID=R0JRU5_ANAPL|nr:hypothetical protein Anapl_06911 [Anas platyrhynchos]
MQLLPRVNAMKCVNELVLLIYVSQSLQVTGNCSYLKPIQKGKDNNCLARQELYAEAVALAARLVHVMGAAT